MSRDSFYPQLFHCPKCNKEVKQYVWLSQLEDAKHDECGTSITAIQEEVNISAHIAGSQFKKGRPIAERASRRIKHFKKEIQPTLGGSDRAHFDQKYGKVD